MTIIYWEKVSKFDRRKRKTTFSLVPIEAVVIGKSEPVCCICHGPEEGHSRRKTRTRPGRKHPFTSPIKGLTLEITNHFQTYTMKNVQQGKKACHWTERK